ncbi:MAG TPA: hypothetical protein VG897_05805 [Terriglobales bacterium]|nr:hypothetical protein [Terriglobales bacterium]
MITRIWHGWTNHENAPKYEQLLRADVLPGIHRVPGFQGAHLLRREAGDEVEFVTLCYFDKIDSVREFAGEDFTVAVVPPEARKLLKRFDQRSEHYETILKVD